MLSEDEIRRLAESEKFFLTTHAIRRLRERWNRGPKSTQAQMRAAVRQFLCNAQVVDDPTNLPTEATVRRFNVEAILTVDDCPRRGMRIGVVTIYTRNHAPIPACAFK